MERKKTKNKTKRKKNKKQPVCELESQLEERSYVSGEFVGEDAGQKTDITLIICLVQYERVSLAYAESEGAA